jgi:hypothetical protein
MPHCWHPSPDTPLALMVDASDFAVGSSLHQFCNGNLEPLGFFSKSLTPTKKQYSTYDRELLAAYLSIKHFRYLVEGKNFVIYTDHKPLSFAFTKPKETRAETHKPSDIPPQKTLVYTQSGHTVQPLYRLNPR